VVLLLGVVMAFGPALAVLPADSVDEIEVPNPLALDLIPAISAMIPAPNTLFAMMGAFFLAGIISVLVRARRAVGLERLQYRWLVAAVVLVAVGTITWLILTEGGLADTHGGAELVVLVSYPAIPIAIAVAVLRYRLYEIDRIISRTISYAVVTGVLIAVFAVAVIVLQGALAGFTQGETLAVAASTLVAFALFQPLRRRVQSVIDRRFDRSRYDGERTTAAFSERLRDQVDLPSVTADLDATVREAVVPAKMAIWLRTESR
jgi:drug/metabolite transporter (DMT)-like permease